VPWRPEDWKEWPEIDGLATYGDAAHVRAVLDILDRLPDLENKRVVELTRGAGSSLHSLASRVEPAQTVDLAAGMPGARLAPFSCDVIVAVDAIESARADAVLADVRASLVEGGVFLATLAARAPGPMGFAMPIRAPRDGFHEVELQFRLVRAMFQGLRLKRLRSSHEPDRILCMAVRRALN